MISACGLSYSIEGKDILRGLNFKARSGSIIGIIGRNGAGKSTLLKILSGVLAADSGSVKYDDCLITKMNYKELGQARSVLSQEVPVSFGLSVLDILMMGRYCYGKIVKRDYSFCDEVIELLNLRPLLSTPYPALSGGERQRVQMGRALIQLMPFSSCSKKIFFLDEPLSALDVSISQDILKLINFLSKKYSLTIILILHDLNWISYYCNDVYLLNDGSVALKGHPKEIFTVDNLKKYFNIESKIFDNENERPTMVFV